MDKTTEQILRRRMHGLYLSRKCSDITQLSRELMGLHCWFHRNVVFSAQIRGAGLRGWQTALTKTWLYRGTLHGVDYDDLPLLLALHRDDSFGWLLDRVQLEEMADKVVRLMEDGVTSRAEMRHIFAYDFDARTLERIFSPWGGIFVYLARQGRVAFGDMKSRDFDLIDAEPDQTAQEALPELLRRYFAAYGPATLADAAWFLGLGRDYKKQLAPVDLDEYNRLEDGKTVYYYIDDGADMGEIPPVTLLAGFDPLIVSYTERGATLPPQYKSTVILKSGICLPTIAVNGQVAGCWNLKKGEPTIEYFSTQPKHIQQEVSNLMEAMRWQTTGIL